HYTAMSFLHRFVDLQTPPSFPTRRSSDLVEHMVVTAAHPTALETPQVSTNLPLKLIERLPIPRNQLATAQFAPGVTANVLSNGQDRKSTRLNSSHQIISYAVFCLKQTPPR